MSDKRLKTLNLCVRSVEHLKTRHEGQSTYARKAILMHETLLEQRDKAIVQRARDEQLSLLLANVIREVYLYPEKATERIEDLLEIDDFIRDWYRKDELHGDGTKWFRNRGYAVLAGVKV